MLEGSRQPPVAAWWLPGWLDQRLPNVDVEGEKLRRQLSDPPEDEFPASSRMYRSTTTGMRSWRTIRHEPVRWSRG
jgi:hypothetical protein